MKGSTLHEPGGSRQQHGKSRLRWATLSACVLLESTLGCAGARGDRAPAGSDDDAIGTTATPVVQQPEGITIDPKGSTIGWIFERGSDICKKGGNGVGQGDHLGDDYYADDWSCGAGNSDQGETLVSGVVGTVIFVGVGAEAGYGIQVAIDLGDGWVLKYTHLDFARVKVGDSVGLGTPIGAVGCSGLSCAGQFTAHLHLVLYRNLDQKAKDGKTGYDQVKLGDNPTWLSGGPSTFAAPFTVSMVVKAPYSQEQVASRISPVVTKIAMPDVITSGIPTKVDWDIMTYHGPTAGVVSISCKDAAGVSTLAFGMDDDAEDLGQGYHVGAIYSRRKRLSAFVTVPSASAPGTCRVRFLWKRLDYPHTKTPIAPVDGIYMTTLLPAAVDAHVVGSEGREVERQVVPGPSGVSGTTTKPPEPDLKPGQEDAARRISPVVFFLGGLPAKLKAGTSVDLEIGLVSYATALLLDGTLTCGTSVADTPQLFPQDLGPSYTVGNAVSHGVSYKGKLTVPPGVSGSCTLRFYAKPAIGADVLSNTALSVLIPSGVDAGATLEGRAVGREVAP